ncbi:MAG: restriction endonuclease, partial [Chloroflexi bacterium]|nr:restriction endonuclease [Chloroflexota bacterium]
MAYTAINIEGGLFTSDLLDDIATGKAEGQKASDFGVNGNRRLTDEIQSAFSDMRLYWETFQRRLERSRESKTTLTREDWMVKVFGDLLGFESLVVQRASAEAGGQTYFISHRKGEHPNSVPVHIASVDQRLDIRDSTYRRSPHALVQDYLNRADALWGIVTNGERLRLLRDTTRLSKPTYLEFDIKGMIEGNLYSEFALLYRLLHSTRFPADDDTPNDCLLEQYYLQGINQGNRVRDKLREGVEDALKVLGTAFLRHPDSRALRTAVERGSLDASSYYRQLLRLVYRLLFLMVAEERKLISPEGQTDTERQAIYTRYYSVWQLRERAERYFAGNNFSDLWVGLRETFRLFRNDNAAKKLGLSALNGELFGEAACRELEGASCTNEELLRAIRHLSTFREG